MNGLNERPHPLLYVLTILALLYLSGYSVAAAFWPRPGFVVAYTVSRLLLEGTDPALAYDDAWFISQVQRFEPTVIDIQVNPPTMTLVALPLAWLPYREARLIWGLVNLGFFLLFVAGVARELKWNRSQLLGGVIAAALFQPVYAQQEQGQLYLFMAVLLFLAWLGYRRQKDVWLGITLAGMLLFKLVGLFLWPLLLVQRRWRALLWGGGVSLGLVLVTLPWLTWASWEAHLRFIPVSGDAAARAVTAYQSLNGLFHHLFRYDAVFNPHPLYSSPGLARGLSFLALISLLVFTLWVGRKTQASDLVFMAVVVLGLIVSPLTLDYHYTLLLLPLGVTGWEMLARPRTSPWLWVMLLVIYLLLALPIPYTTPLLSYGWLSFLAYPKLYAGCLLWGLCLFLAAQKQNTPLSDQAPAVLFVQEST